MPVKEAAPQSQAREQSETADGSNAPCASVRPIDAAVEAAAAAVLLADPSDRASIDALASVFWEIERSLGGAENELIRHHMTSCREILEAISSEETKDPSSALAALASCVTEIQRTLRSAARAAAASPAPPEAEASGELPPRRLEALPAPAAVAQTVESGSTGPASEAPAPPAEAAAPMAEAPTQEAEAVAAAVEAAASAVEPSACAGAPRRVERDADTIGLIGEFLTESEEGLANAEQILMKIETGQTDAEGVNALFRVFHTIKGVAGFLDFPSIQTLAHKTETLLNLARERKIELNGAPLDLVFESTDLMRKMIESVQRAVERCEELVPPAGLEAAIARLVAAAEGGGAGNAGTVGIAGNAAASPAAPPAPKAAPPTAGSTPNETVAARPGSPAAPAPAADAPAADAPEPAREAAAPTGAAREPAPQGAAADSCGKIVQVKESVRIDADRLDRLLDTIGELVIAESMVSQSSELRRAVSTTVLQHLNRLDKITRELQDLGTSLRMVPVRGVFQKMARLVRDLTHKSGKRVEFVTSGEETEIDKSVVDSLGDPLVHMIRNSVDHGIEPPEERTKAGKRAHGTINLAAYHKGGNIFIEISDDGRGLDPDAILAKARERGLVKPDETLDEREIFNLIFAPGLSTAKKVTDVSGRGVGMDVVRRVITDLRGTVDISSTRGAGSVFTIRLPLTLAIIEGMVVLVGQERCIIPTLSVVCSFRPKQSELFSVLGRGEMVSIHGKLIPLLRLHRLFAIEGAKQDPTTSQVVVVEEEGRQAGLLIDELLGQQQIVIKSLGSALRKVEGASGAAIMPDGRVSLILDVGGLLRLTA